MSDLLSMSTETRQNPDNWGILSSQKDLQKWQDSYTHNFGVFGMVNNNNTYHYYLDLLVFCICFVIVK